VDGGGEVSRWTFDLNRRRIHGAIRNLSERATSALVASIEADGRGELFLAASLRGKARGLREAVDVLNALEADRRLPTKRGRYKRPTT
jgi:hypothetical protein